MINIKRLNASTLAFYSACLFAFFSPVSITLAEIFFLLSLAAALYCAAREKGGIARFFALPAAAAVAVFCAWHIIAAAMGVDPARSLKDARKIYLLLAMFSTAFILAQKGRLLPVLGFYAAGSAFVGLYASITTIAFRFVKGEAGFRASSFSGNHMHAGGMLMMGVVLLAGIAVYYLLKKENRAALLFGAASLVSALGLLFTFTRGSWLGAAAGLLILAVFADRRLLIALLVAGIILFFGLKDTQFGQRAADSFNPKQGSSAGERLYMWKAGIDIVKDNPLTGIGTGALEKVYPDYRYPEAVEMNAGHVHNNFIQAAVISGIPGLVFLLFLFVSIFAGFVKALKKASKETKPLIYAFIAVVAAFFVNGFFEYNLFSSQVALMLWMLTGAGFAAAGLDEEN